MIPSCEDFKDDYWIDEVKNDQNISPESIETEMCKDFDKISSFLFIQISGIKNYPMSRFCNSLLHLG
jgi:hypothetical protein